VEFPPAPQIEEEEKEEDEGVGLRLLACWN
jgi:hypothetical protein